MRASHDDTRASDGAGVQKRYTRDKAPEGGYVDASSAP